jgi:hypothetical protein
MTAKKETLTPQQRRINTLVAANEDKTNELKRVNRALKATEEALEKKNHLDVFVDSVVTAKRSVPVLKRPPARSSKNPWAASLVFVTSDLQMGEVVDPRSVRGFNAYDVRIAQERFRHTARSLVKMAFEGMPTYEYDELIVVSNGDDINGDVHDSQESNEVGPIEQTLLVISEYEAAIRLYASVFPKVRYILVPGNHDRREGQKKAKFNNESHDTFTYLAGMVLKNSLKDLPNVTVEVSDSVAALFSVYGTVFSAEHGHRVKGGSDAWAGIMPALARNSMKRSLRDQQMGTPVDHYIYSHYHQLTLGPSFTMSGSYVGVNEMSFALALGVQPPMMPLLVVTPERGITTKLSIDCRAPGEEKLFSKVGRNEWLT